MDKNISLCMHKLVFSLIAILQFACTDGNFSANSAKLDNNFDEPRHARSDGDGRRPSEQGEGVVGYLRDPAELDVERRDGTIHIRGQKNSVVVEQGRLEDLVICMQALPKAAFKTLRNDKNYFGGPTILTLAEARSGSDGSFLLVAQEKSVPADSLIAVNFSGRCSNGGISLITRANQIVMTGSESGDGFVDIDRFKLPESDEAATAPQSQDKTDDVATIQEDKKAVVLCAPNEDCPTKFRIEVIEPIKLQSSPASLKFAIYASSPSCMKQKSDSDCGQPIEQGEINSKGSMYLRAGSYLIIFSADQFQSVEADIPSDVIEGVLTLKILPVGLESFDGQTTQLPIQ